MVSELPAVLGGDPAFSTPLPMVRPTLPEYATMESELKEVIDSGMLTNSTKVRLFEERVKAYTGAQSVVAVSNCTAGMMLVARVQKWSGQVIVPSFTFPATVHAVAWNGLEPMFVDCREKTFNIAPSSVQEAINPKTRAILATHIFGNPADMTALSEIAADHKLFLAFDAAHALGSLYQGRHLSSYEHTQVYSLSPTKLVVAAEGGIVTTSSKELAEGIKVGRNYGNPANYDCQIIGLNARLSELHAVLAIHTLREIEANVSHRNEIANRWRDMLSQLPGLSFQTVEPGNRSTFKDFAIVIDKDKFGLTRDALSAALLKENIASKRYFYPPVHAQRAYAKPGNHARSLTNTIRLSSSILCLPIYSHMTDNQVNAIAAAIARIAKNASKIAQVISAVS